MGSPWGQRNPLLGNLHAEDFLSAVNSLLVKLFMTQNFIPASNEPSAVLARAFGECREGQRLINFKFLVRRNSCIGSQAGTWHCAGI